MLTRRHFMMGALTATAVTALGLIPSGQARAQSVDPAELMQSGSSLPDMVLGAQDAPVTVVEYASMTCGHCAAFHVGTWPAFKERYVDTGKVRFILREFPLDPLAAAAFMLARCAPQERYFDMVDLFFTNQRAWTYTDDPATAMFEIAKQAGFTRASFEECLTNQQLLDAINAVKDRAAADFGVDSTPTFFINGEMMRGARNIDEFQERIDPLVAG